MPKPRADAIPPWRAALLAIPSSRRSPSQRDLVRGLELADQVQAGLERIRHPSLNDPNTLKLVLTAIECFLLGPFEQSAVLLWAEEHKEKLSRFLLILNKEGTQSIKTEAVPESFPATAAYHLWSLCAISGFSIDPLGLRDIFDEFPAVVDTLDWSGDVQRTLTAHRSGLDAATLKQAMHVVNASFLVKVPQNLPVAKYLVTNFIIPVSKMDNPAPWQLAAVTKAYRFLAAHFEGDPPLPVLFGYLPGSQEAREAATLLFLASKVCTDALKAAVTRAEAENDDGRVALYAGPLLSVILTMGVDQARVSQTRGALKKATAAISRARAWLPRTHRLFLASIDITAMIKGVPDHEFITGTAYYNATGLGMPQGATTGERVWDEEQVAVRTCASCGAKGQELMACAGCKTRWYCNRRCQTAHWKRGHKAECKELQETAAGPATSASAKGKN